MSLTLNLKPEIEAGLLERAQATGLSVEDYVGQLVERELSAHGEEASNGETGMVWEDGLLVYRTGKPLPPSVIDSAIQRLRDDRANQILGNRS